MYSFRRTGERPDLRVKEIMSREIHTIELDAQIASAAQKMLDTNSNCLVVTAGGSVAGTITAQEMIIGCLMQSHDSEECRVFNHMVLQPDMVDAGMHLGDLAMALTGRDVEVLPVMDHGEVVGLVSTSDIFDAMDWETLRNMTVR